MKNLAIIDAGYWGKNLVRNFHELGVLKTVCDGDSNCRKKIQDSYPGIGVVDDFDVVLNDPEIQVVVIATPAALHFSLAEKALMADKDVFVEKPLSLTYADGESLVRMAAKRKKSSSSAISSSTTPLSSP